jgi:nicotinate-nucleotide pyrophosphorylase
LTPNRIDAGSHIGVARDLVAYLRARGEQAELKLPSVEAFAVDNNDLKIEVEVRNFDELNQVLALEGVDRVMLDNFSVENTRKAVEIVNGRLEVESSGGITFDTIRSYAECGVDFVSVGALTHSVKSLDMSFKAVND